MFDIKKRKQFETVGELKKLLADVPDDAAVAIGGLLDCWFHIETDRSLICLDQVELEDCY